MKKKEISDLLLFIILSIVVIFVAFFIQKGLSNKIPNYSVLSNTSKGCSAFYETLRELNIPAERTTETVEHFQKDNIQIIADGGTFDLTSSEIKSWISKGGTIVYLESGNDVPLEYGISPEIQGSFQIYNYKRGKIISFSAESITNKALSGKTDNAYELFQQIQKITRGKIYFNEAYLFSASENRTMWDYIPIEYKFILYQILLCIVALFYMKGKRFGKIVPIYEEEERIENEYLYSAASLYRQADCWDIMLESYYNSFLRELNCWNENWLKYWERESLPSFSKAKMIYEFMGSPKEKVNIKKYIQVVSTLDHLKIVLKKRRDMDWKTLKKLQ